MTVNERRQSPNSSLIAVMKIWNFVLEWIFLYYKMVSTIYKACIKPQEAWSQSNIWKFAARYHWISIDLSPHPLFLCQPFFSEAPFRKHSQTAHWLQCYVFVNETVQALVPNSTKVSQHSRHFPVAWGSGYCNVRSNGTPRLGANSFVR